MLNKGLGSKLAKLFGAKQKGDALVIPRNQHKLSRKNISDNALKVLYRLKKAGYAGYLVGGGVRDLLLKRAPKDFDVATDGHPEALRKLFVNSCIIGRRFRLLHVFFPGEIIEVSTFRANAQEDASTEEREDDAPLVIAADNTYGTIEEDAWRRDFTVNALYYNIADFSVVDFMGGMLDLKHRIIRMIGDPVQRYHEDPVRLLRAIRLAAKLRFKIHPQTETPLKELSGLLRYVPESRLFDEVLKIFFEGNAVSSYRYLQRYDYIEVLFPKLSAILRAKKNAQQAKLIELALKATDERFSDKRSLNPGFLLSVLLWPLVLKRLEENEKEFAHFYQALHHTIDEVITEQNTILRIPRRFTAMMRSIWMMQYQLVRRRGKRVYRTLRHRYFRAAFDFLVLRAQAGEPYQKEVDWWQEFQKANHTEQKEMVFELSKRKRR